MARSSARHEPTPRRRSDVSTEPRSICERCRRPTAVCYCAHVVPLTTRTRVLLLQHPRERDVAINTARIAKLCLPEAELATGVDFTGDARLEAALDDGAWLLYPGPGAERARDLQEEARPRVLIVLDGTWWQARSILKRNPRLASLPRLSLSSGGESRYRIRAEPAPQCMATIEALARALTELEPEPERFAKMLEPFDAMVETQIRFARDVRASRQKKLRPPRPRRVLPAWLAERAEHLVVIHLEANAWPRSDEAAPRDEIVQFLAVRPASGETFEAVVRPSGELAPSTPVHIQVGAERLRAGDPFEVFAERWRRFLRATDVAVTWGSYTPRLARASGVAMPEIVRDLRPVVQQYLGERAGTLEHALVQLGLPEPATMGAGRGGRRVAAIAAATLKLSASDPFAPRAGRVERTPRRRRRPV